MNQKKADTRGLWIVIMEARMYSGSILLFMIGQLSPFTIL